MSLRRRSSVSRFTEGKTQIEAFYIMDCRDIDEATRRANRLPAYGKVEVRPLLEYDYS